MRRLRKIKQTIIQRNQDFVEENGSLWDMLDEMKGSSSFGTDQMKSAMEDLKDMLTEEMLRDFKPIGEA